MSRASRKASSQKKSAAVATQQLSNTSSSGIFASRFGQPNQPLNVQDLEEIEQPLSLDSSNKVSLEAASVSKYRVVQRLLPDVSLARHIVNSDDHAFASLDECCHDLNNNADTSLKMTPEGRRDHLHLMRRRKSRARFLTNEELLKLQHFRKFLLGAGVGPHILIHRILQIRHHERLHAYDENGVPAAKDEIR
jgi:hypothetical protein